MRYFILSIVTAVSMNAMASSPISIKIVGGVKAADGEIPFIVGLHDNTMLEPFCGGTLIAKNWVLTAAHCVENQSKIFVDIGMYNLSDRSNVQTIASTKFYTHPLKNSNTMAYDFALIRLPSEANQEPVAINQDEISIPKSIADAPVVMVAGWGLTSESGYTSPEILHKVNVHLIDQVTCNKDYDNQILDSMICAGEEKGGKDACQGDSGGPLLMQNADMTYKLIGVVSFGEGCARAKYPGVYAKVSAAYDWIQKTMSTH